MPVRITDSSFGIFTANGGGTGPGILQNFIAADTQAINSVQQATKLGQVLTPWSTGLGAATFPSRSRTHPSANRPTESPLIQRLAQASSPRSLPSPPRTAAEND